MKQEAFEQRFARRWQEFDDWLAASRSKVVDTNVIADAQIPARYRELTQHLALARDRQYSAQLIERLSALALAGHQILYGARGRGFAGLFDFVFKDFPVAVRREWRVVALASVLFFGPLLVIAATLQRYPDFAYVMLPADQLETIETMYGKAAGQLGREREADTDAAMFGFYIFNNVRIGFQTFAGGLLFGLGALFYLLYNGLHIGAITGYLIHVGLSENFFSFTSGHSAFELSAIALCGAAGLKLGFALIAPGRLRRGEALRQAAASAVVIVAGAAGMLFIAAGIEAFWSPRTAMAPAVKYTAGGVLWLLLLCYFVFTGRRHGA